MENYKITSNGGTGLYTEADTGETYTLLQLVNKMINLCNKVLNLIPITTDNVADLSITSQKLANASVTYDKIAEGTITGYHIGDGSITPDKLKTGSQTTWAFETLKAVDLSARNVETNVLDTYEDSEDVYITALKTIKCTKDLEVDGQLTCVPKKISDGKLLSTSDFTISGSDAICNIYINDYIGKLIYIPETIITRLGDSSVENIEFHWKNDYTFNIIPTPYTMTGNNGFIDVIYAIGATGDTDDKYVSIIRERFTGGLLLNVTNSGLLIIDYPYPEM